MHKAVFKNGFDHGAFAFGNRVHRHKLRLHIGGETGVRLGADVDRFRAVLHIDSNPVVARFDDGTGFHQFFEHHFHGFRCGVAQHHFAAGHRHRAEEGTGFDAVGYYAVFAAVQFFHAFNRHHWGADAADFGAHFHQTFGQIDYFRLDGAVFQYGGAFGQSGGHQQVFGTADGNKIHHHARAFEFAFGFYITVFDGDFGTHRFQAF